MIKLCQRNVKKETEFLKNDTFVVEKILINRAIF